VALQNVVKPGTVGRLGQQAGERRSGLPCRHDGFEPRGPLIRMQVRENTVEDGVGAASRIVAIQIAKAVQRLGVNCSPSFGQISG
jgi:hypothetical protein